jgi:hypothetical protein
MTPQQLFARALSFFYPRERMQDPKPQKFYCYSAGPMFYIGQQIVAAMQKAGYPAKIQECLRSADRQAALKSEGRSRAGPFESPHQFSEAVDIVHPSLFWKVSEDYWDALDACAQTVSRRLGVELETGYSWGWDKAHIELKDWRVVRDRLGKRHPEPEDLNRRFAEVLPSVWASRPMSSRL